MASSRNTLRETKGTNNNAMLRVSLVLAALVSSGMGASAPPLGHSKQGTSLDPRGSSPHDARVVAANARPSSADEAVFRAGSGDFLTLCVDFSDLPEQLASSRDYRVVAVTGCQCSGKSTLMNALFGTGFPVLEHADDALPQRTTIGAWVDLQLCPPPKRRKPKAPKSSSANTGSPKTSPPGGRRRSRSRKTRPADTAATAAARPEVLTKKKTAEVAATAAEREDEASGKRGTTPVSSAGGVGLSGGEKGLSRTGATKGVATGAPAAAPTPFVLVDVEGTQSRDRGAAEGVEFDSRTTLFAVMAADVVMLNLWAHDVGRADGQAYSVLRSVFEETVRLYEGQGGYGIGGNGSDGTGVGVHRGGDGGGAVVGAARFPKVLMVVLRDVEEDGHFEALDRAARANMEALWRDVDKPSSLRDAELSEIFDLRTSGLPHFVYQRREFAAKAEALSRYFLDPSHGDFVFSRPRHQAGVVGGEPGGGQRPDPPRGRPGRQAVVPLSKLRRHLEEIWASASSNIRLAHAPRRSEQQGAVALAALAESCLSEVRPRCARLLADVEEAAAGDMPLLQFGSDAQGIVDAAVRSFHARASRSHPPIDVPPALLREKRGWLIAAVARELEPAFRVHARHLRGHFHEQFEEVFSCVLGGAADFDLSSRRMSKAVRGNFIEATKLAIPDTPGVADVWRLHWEAELVKLNEDMESRVQDRLSEGTWMLPPDPAEQAAAGRNKMPWWKGLVLRAAAMYFNYLQATQHLRRARKASERREREVPRLPLF